jgi:hypothetical protein
LGRSDNNVSIIKSKLTIKNMKCDCQKTFINYKTHGHRSGCPNNKPKEDERVNMAEITLSHGTQLIKINLPTGKEVLQIQDRLDEVWIVLKSK